jgi:glucokinase
MVGVGIPGITNVETGVVKAAPFLSEWRDVPFRAMLEEHLNVSVCVENDVNLAALGEAEAGIAKGEKDFVFLAVGTGFGAGIMLRGELYQGADWASGEVGYLRVCGACEAPLDASRPGPLENIIGGPAIERAWNEGAPDNGQPSGLSATRVFELAETGLPLAVRLLDRTASLLSSAITNISLVLNCPLFVLGGGVGSSIPLRRAVSGRLRLNNVISPRLESSALGHDAQLIGAVRFALNSKRVR